MFKRCLNIPREQSQFISLTFLAFGLFVMFGMPNPLYGVAMIGISCWILMMSESLLHARVQLEMSHALENLRKKQEAEVQELLYFLRDSKISAQPFDSMDGAKRLCEHISYPAMVLTANHQIIKANELMHDTLGWQHKTLKGVAAHYINVPAVMSRIGELMALPENAKRKSMVTQYAYMHKTGSKVFGQMDAHEISPTGSLEGFFVVFHPEDECAMSAEEVKNLAT